MGDGAGFDISILSDGQQFKRQEYHHCPATYAKEVHDLKELFNCISATIFGPAIDMTHAMLVTVLCRLEGRPTVTMANGFANVEKRTAFYVDCADARKVKGDTMT